MEYLTLAKVGAPYGVKGWVKITHFTAEAAALQEYANIFIAEKGAWQPIKIQESKLHSGRLVVLFEGIADRTAAEGLTNKELAILASDLPEPADGEFYWHQLEGLEVINQQGFSFGKVSHLMETGSNDVLCVDGDKEYLIPFILEKYVLEVDLAAGKILVDWEDE